jgi:hypothetical protein
MQQTSAYLNLLSCLLKFSSHIWWVSELAVTTT